MHQCCRHGLFERSSNPESMHHWMPWATSLSQPRMTAPKYLTEKAPHAELSFTKGGIYRYGPFIGKFPGIFWVSGSRDRDVMNNPGHFPEGQNRKKSFSTQKHGADTCFSLNCRFLRVIQHRIRAISSDQLSYVKIRVAFWIHLLSRILRILVSKLLESGQNWCQNYFIHKRNLGTLNWEQIKARMGLECQIPATYTWSNLAGTGMNVPRMRHGANWNAH